jgi:hypothetical protein
MVPTEEEQNLANDVEQTSKRLTRNNRSLRYCSVSLFYLLTTKFDIGTESLVNMMMTMTKSNLLVPNERRTAAGSTPFERHPMALRRQSEFQWFPSTAGSRVEQPEQENSCK